MVTALFNMSNSYKSGLQETENNSDLVTTIADKSSEIYIVKRCKHIPVTGCGGPYSCQTSRLPHFLDTWLTDGGEVVSLTRRLIFTPRKIPGTHFSSRLSRPQGHSAGGRVRSTEKSDDPIGNRTRDLPACSIGPQPSTLSSAPDVNIRNNSATY
jgi:hypothetical protein